MTKIKNLVKFLIASCLFFIFALFFLLALFSNSSPIAMGDISIIYIPEQLWHAFQFPWDHLTNFGKPNILLGNAIYNSMIYGIYSIVGDIPMAHKLLIVLIFTATGVVSYYLLIKLPPRKSWAAFLASVTNMFNLYMVHRFIIGHNTILLGYPIFIFATKTLLDKPFEKFTKLLLFLLASELLVLTNPHFFGIFLLSCVIYSFCYLLNGQRASKLVLKEKLLNVISIYLIPLSAALPFVLHEFLVVNRSYVIRQEEVGFYNSLFLENLLRDTFETPLSIAIIGFFMYACLVISLYIITIRGRSIVSNLIQSRFFIYNAIVGLFLAMGFLPPFRQLFLALMRIVPFFWIYRDTGKFMVLPIFSLSYFLYISLSRTLRPKKLKLVNRVVLVVTLLSFCIYLSAVAVYANTEIQTIDLPDYYKKMYEIFHLDNGDYKVTYIPPASWAANYTWANRSFLDFTISQQIKQTLGLPTEMELTLSDQFLRWLMVRLYYNYSWKWDELLKLIGIKYVVVRGDVSLPQNRDDFKSFPPAQMRHVFKYLASGENLNKVRLFDNKLIILKLNDALPLMSLHDRVGYIIGDKDTLMYLSKIGFPLTKTLLIFPENLDEESRYRISKPDILILNDGSLSAMIASFSKNAIRIDPSKFTNLTVDASTWTFGDLCWYIIPGELSSSPSYYALTVGYMSKMVLPIDVKEQGEYHLYIKALTGNLKTLGKIMLIIGNETSFINLSTRKIGLSYKWIDAGTWHLQEGANTLVIKNLGGLSAISSIVLIPKNGNEINQILSDNFSNVTFVFLITPEEFERSDFSNMYAYKLSIPSDEKYYLYLYPIYGTPDTMNKSIDIMILRNDSNTTLWQSIVRLNYTLDDAFFNLGAITLTKGEYTLKVKSQVDVKKIMIVISNRQQPFMSSVERPTLQVGRMANGLYMVKLPPLKNTRYLLFTESYNEAFRLIYDGKNVKPILAYSAFNGFVLPSEISEEKIVSVEYMGIRYMLIGASCKILLITLYLIGRFSLKGRMGLIKCREKE